MHVGFTKLSQLFKGKSIFLEAKSSWPDRALLATFQQEMYINHLLLWIPTITLHNVVSDRLWPPFAALTSSKDKEVLLDSSFEM
jgi:hypothetical protein